MPTGPRKIFDSCWVRKRTWSGKSKAIAKEIENIVINDPNTQSYFTIVQKDSFL